MARDKYHEIVKLALIKDGWTITHDPLRLRLPDESKSIFIDLGAEKLVAAERGEEKIAVEIKSFLNVSGITNLYEAIGKFTIYSLVMEKNEPDRVLYLAIPLQTYLSTFKRTIAQMSIERFQVKIIVYNLEKTEIDLWIH